MLRQTSLIGILALVALAGCGEDHPPGGGWEDGASDEHGRSGPEGMTILGLDCMRGGECEASGGGGSDLGADSESDGESQGGAAPQPGDTHDDGTDEEPPNEGGDEGASDFEPAEGAGDEVPAEGGEDGGGGDPGGVDGTPGEGQGRGAAAGPGVGEGRGGTRRRTRAEADGVVRREGRVDLRQVTLKIVPHFVPGLRGMDVGAVGQVTVSDRVEFHA